MTILKYRLQPQHTPVPLRFRCGNSEQSDPQYSKDYEESWHFKCTSSSLSFSSWRDDFFHCFRGRALELLAVTFILCISLNLHRVLQGTYTTDWYITQCDGASKSPDWTTCLSSFPLWFKLKIREQQTHAPECVLQYVVNPHLQGALKDVTFIVHLPFAPITLKSSPKYVPPSLLQVSFVSRK